MRSKLTRIISVFPMTRKSNEARPMPVIDPLGRTWIYTWGCRSKAQMHGGSGSKPSHPEDRTARPSLIAQGFPQRTSWRPLAQIPIDLIRHCERKRSNPERKALNSGLLGRPVGAPRDDRADPVRSDRALFFLMEHDLFGKPVSTFPDHAFYWSMIFSENRFPLFRIML